MNNENEEMGYFPHPFVPNPKNPTKTFIGGLVIGLVVGTVLAYCLIGTVKLEQATCVASRNDLQAFNAYPR